VHPVQQLFEPGHFPIAIGFDRNPITQHSSDGSASPISEESAYLTIACRGGKIGSWDLVSGQPLSATIEHDQELIRVLAVPQSTDILTLDAEQSVHLWNRDGSLRCGPLRTVQPVTVVLADVKTDRILIGTNDGVVSFWKLSDGSRLEERLVLPTQIAAASFSPDGWLAVGDASGIVRLADLNGKVINLPHKGWITGVDFSPDGKWLASGCRDHQVRFWSLARLSEGGPVDRPDGEYSHQGDVRFVAFDQTSRLLMSGANDYTVRLWDLNAMEEVGPPLRHQGIPLDAKFIDQEHIVTSATDNVIRTWDFVRGRQTSPEIPVISSLLSFALSEDGETSSTELARNYIPGSVSREIRCTLGRCRTQIPHLALAKSNRPSIPSRVTPLGLLREIDRTC
jgi:WD40 repeat protein